MYISMIIDVHIYVYISLYIVSGSGFIENKGHYRNKEESCRGYLPKCTTNNQ